MNKPQIIAYLEESLGFTPFGVKWVPQAAKLAAFGSTADGKGIVKIFELDGPAVKIIDKICLPNSIQCGTFSSSPMFNRQLAVGDLNGSLRIVDLMAGNKTVYSAKAHNEMIYAVDGIAGQGIGRGAPEIVTGGKDGSVRLWDPRQRNSVLTLEPTNASCRIECWSAAMGNAYNESDRVIGAGFSNGDIRLFDLRACAMKWETNLSNGICDLQFDRKDIEMNKLVASTLESGIVTFDLRTLHPEDGYAFLHKTIPTSTTVWRVRHLPQNRDIFMTSCGSGVVHLWNYSYPQKRAEQVNGFNKGVMGDVDLLSNAQVSTQPIVDMDWCRDKIGLSACVSLDELLRILIITKLNTY